MSFCNRTDITVDHHDLFKALFESSPILMAMLDPQFNYIQVNHAYAEADEKEPSFFSGKNHFDLYPNDENRQVFRKVVDNGQPYQNQTKPFKNERNKERGVTWWDWSLVPVKDDSGRVTALILSLVDVTKQKRAEKELRQSEWRFDLAVQATSDGIWEWNIVTNEEYFAPRWCEIIGYSHDDPELPHTYDSWAARIHPDDHERVMQVMKAHLEAGEIYDVDYRHRHKSGEYRWQNSCGQAVFDDHGKPVRMVGCIRDITERKKAEEALAHNEERFKRLFQLAPLGYQSLDENGDYLEVNDAWCRTLGYSRDEVIGHNFGEFIDPDFRDIYQRCFPKFKNEGLLEGVELTMIKKDGARIIASFVGRVGYNDDGSFKQTHCIFVDITERKKAEDRVRLLLDNLPCTAMILKKGTREIVASNNAAHSLGAIPGTTCYGTCAQRQESCTFCKAPEVWETGERREIEVEHEGVWYYGIWVPLDDDLYVHYIFDITDRKRAEEALRESEEKHRELTENLPQRIFHKDANLVYVSCNEHFARDLGFAPNEITGKTDFDLYPRELAEKYREEDRRLMASGQTEEIEESSIKEGQELFVQTVKTPLTDDSGNVTGILGIFWDITERKKAEEALRESEEKFRTYISHAPDAIFIADPQGRYVDVNEAACCLTGYSKIELTSMSITDLTDPEHISEARARFENFTETGSLSTESRFRRKDGSIVCVSLDAVVLSEGVFMAFCSDITETKRLRELESRAQRLETAGQIAGQVAHDFNNLLAPLMAYPEFIRDELGPDHSALQYLDDIENAAQQIADINQQLLTLGRRGHYNQEPMNLNEVVSQAIRQMESLPSTLVVASKLDEDLMNIKGGRSQIFRAISNLLSNAREAMQDIGQITVRTENFYVDEMWISYARVPQGEYVKLTISDTGCGIPDEIKQKIFEPFFTTKTTDKKRGSGLGISVVDAVIKDHEGHIDVASVMGEGTSFFLYFPVTRDSINTPSHHEIVGGRGSILIVDDDKVQRDVCTKLLNSLGYQSTVVGSGEEALKALGDQRYDLLILDMIMPLGIDGAETFRQTLLINPDQKAIIVSGFAESDRVAAALKMGAGAFVKKPLTRRRLAVAVRDELDRVVHPA